MCWYHRCRGLYKYIFFFPYTKCIGADILHLKRNCASNSLLKKGENNINVYIPNTHLRAMNIEGCLFFSSCFESYIVMQAIYENGGVIRAGSDFPFSCFRWCKLMFIINIKRYRFLFLPRIHNLASIGWSITVSVKTGKVYSALEYIGYKKYFIFLLWEWEVKEKLRKWKIFASFRLLSLMIILASYF